MILRTLFIIIKTSKRKMVDSNGGWQDFFMQGKSLYIDGFCHDVVYSFLTWVILYLCSNRICQEYRE
jgi:hypothetical protein